MVVGNYIPVRGDIVWIDFNPQAGHEQMGRRPAIVISQNKYNEKTSLAVFCPITNVIKGYPFEVILPDNTNINGAILSDQVKSLDWKERNVEFIMRAPVDTLHDVLKKINLLIN